MIALEPVAQTYIARLTICRCNPTKLATYRARLADYISR